LSDIFGALNLIENDKEKKYRKCTSENNEFVTVRYVSGPYVE
jgi:hypothetical protein